MFITLYFFSIVPWVWVISMVNKQSDFFKKHILNDPVWYNSCIKVANKSLFINSWHKSSIRLVGVFFSDNGSFLPYAELLYKIDLHNEHIMLVTMSRKIFFTIKKI